jgi:hypothetical protein
VTKLQKKVVLLPSFVVGKSHIPNEAFLVKRNGKDVLIQSFTSNVPSCIEENREKSIRERTRLAPRSRS